MGYQVWLRHRAILSERRWSKATTGYFQSSLRSERDRRKTKSRLQVLLRLRCAKAPIAATATPNVTTETSDVLLCKRRGRCRTTKRGIGPFLTRLVISRSRPIVELAGRLDEQVRLRQWNTGTTTAGENSITVAGFWFWFWFRFRRICRLYLV